MRRVALLARRVSTQAATPRNNLGADPGFISDRAISGPRRACSRDRGDGHQTRWEVAALVGDVKRCAAGVTNCNQSCTQVVVATSIAVIYFRSCVTTESKEDRLGSPSCRCRYRGQVADDAGLRHHVARRLPLLRLRSDDKSDQHIDCALSGCCVQLSDRSALFACMAPPSRKRGKGAI
jgi:hypothetical protein